MAFLRQMHGAEHAGRTVRDLAGIALDVFHQLLDVAPLRLLLDDQEHGIGEQAR